MNFVIMFASSAI